MTDPRMNDPTDLAAMRRQRSLLPAMALAGLGLAVAWLAVDAVPLHTQPTPLHEQAERMALTMLACGMAALAILAGIVALTLERSLEAPAKPSGSQAASPSRVASRPARPGQALAGSFREAA